MLPKFLKVTVFVLDKVPVWINETHFIEKFFLRYLDQSLLDVYARAVGFSYEIVLPPEDGISWPLPNGTWTGVLGMLQRREVDMIVGDVIITEQVSEYFRVIYPNFINELTFTTKKLEPVTSNAHFLHPFSIQVWLSIIACIFLMSLLFYSLLRSKHAMVSLFTKTLGSLVGQAIGITPRSGRDYFAFASWILSSALLYYFYAAVLLSFLTCPSLQGVRTIDDLAEAIEEGQYKCLTVRDSPVYWYLKNFENPAARTIGNNIEFCDKLTAVECLETSAGNKKRAFIGYRSVLIAYEQFNFISEENFYSITSGTFMHKDFCCGSEMDKVVHRAWASGIFQGITRNLINYRFIKDLKRTAKYWDNPPEEGRLTMTQLKGPFIFLVASLSLAFLVFLIEVFSKKLKRLVPRKLLALVAKGKISHRPRQRAIRLKKL